MSAELDSPPPEGVLIEVGFGPRIVEFEKKLDRETRRWLDWPMLAQSDAPEYEWLIEHWLGWHTTLLSGRGSTGKTLLAQQLGTALALGNEFIGPARSPLRVLMWACEDDEKELWRRQERICKDQGALLGQLQGSLWIDARLGLKNELYGPGEYGKMGWGGAYGELLAQIEETQAEVLILDNIGHAFAGSENNRHDVTTFCAGIAGLVPDRPFASILIGHIAKGVGSEYAGSTAWENAVRMRWYMGEKLPDEQEHNGDDEPDSSVRFLCKRKANYTALDYVQLNYNEGVFKVNRANGANGADGSGLTGSLRFRQAQRVVLDGLAKLTKMGMSAGSTKGPNFLPNLIAEYKLNEDLGRGDIKNAMQSLMLAGTLIRGVVGQYPNRTPKYGLKVSD